MDVTKKVSTLSRLKERSHEQIRGSRFTQKKFTVSFYDADSAEHIVRVFKLKDLESFKKKLDKEDVLSVEMTGNTRYFVEQI